MTDKMTGGCACGRVRFEAEIDSDEAYLCHCRMCQRASGNVSLAMKNVPQGAVRWARGARLVPKLPRSPSGPYCATCGTSLGFRYDEDTDQMDLTVAAFDDPSRFKPTSHFGAESIHEAWIDTTPAEATRTDEYQKLVDRWRRSWPKHAAMSSAPATAGPPPTGSSWPGTRWARGGRDPAPRPVLDAPDQLDQFGNAARIAAAGFRVIMPDLRAHGLSDKPHDAGALSATASSPATSTELIAHLGLDDYRPRRLFARRADGRAGGRARGFSRAARSLPAWGSRGLPDWQRRKHFFLDAIAIVDTATRGDPHWLAIQFMKTMKIDRVAARLCCRPFDRCRARLARRLHDADAGAVRQRGRGQWLGAASSPRRLPDADLRAVPGTHMSSVTKPEFGEAIAAFSERLDARRVQVSGMRPRDIRSRPQDEDPAPMKHACPRRFPVRARARRLRHHPPRGRPDISRRLPARGRRAAPSRADRGAGRCLRRRGRKGSVRLFGRGEPGELGQRHQHHRRHRRGRGQDQRGRHRKERQICARSGQICAGPGAELRHQAQARYPAHRHRPARADHAGRGDRAQQDRDQAPVRIMARARARSTASRSTVATSKPRWAISSTRPQQFAEMWTSWHDNVGAPMKNDYARMVGIANAGVEGAWVSPTPARCGARAMTCRPSNSPPRPSGCGRK